MARSLPSAIRIDEADGVAFVFLREGFEAVIDLEDLPMVEGKAWRLLSTRTGHGYAYARVPGNPMLLMHRMLMNTASGFQVDHIDGDGLNNRRSNMRNATPAQNQANRVVQRSSALGLKGVRPNRHGRRFRSTIRTKGITINLGSYATPEEAAAAYNGAAKVLWGDFAYGAMADKK